MVELPENTSQLEETPIREFSLYINKASFDKSAADPNDRMRWFAVASDTDPDSYEDSMSLELYSDFMNRIESKELPPERHRSDYWSGGMPYLSISHYLDLNGEGVPGPVDSIYVDGKCLKAKGRFYDNELGRTCFDAICKDLYSEEKSDLDKVRISIAFLDWAHRHKSTGYEFVRQSLSDICPECQKESLLSNGEGLEFLKGHLIHLALTRVPVNKRTLIERLEEDMVTQVEDAETIVGKEKAEELETKQAEIGKSEALVIKAEQEETVEVKAEQCDDEDEEEKKKKAKEEEEKSLATDEHVLQSAWDEFKALYDEVGDHGYQEKLKAIQPAFEKLGESIKSSFEPTKEEVELQTLGELKELITGQNDLIVNQGEQLRSLSQEIEILKQQRLENKPVTSQETRRSITLDPSQLFQPAQNGPMSLKDIVKSTT